MKTTNFGGWLFAAFAMTLSAGVLAQNSVRISEFHYDNGPHLLDT